MFTPILEQMKYSPEVLHHVSSSGQDHMFTQFHESRYIFDFYNWLFSPPTDCTYFVHFTS